MRRYILAFVTVISLIISSCQDNDDIWYSYNETQCADPWMTGIGNNETEVKDSVENYLVNLDVVVSDIEINNDGIAEVCLACACLSGRIIRVLSTEEAENVLTTQGFERE